MRNQNKFHDKQPTVREKQKQVGTSNDYTFERADEHRTWFFDKRRDGAYLSLEIV